MKNLLLAIFTFCLFAFTATAGGQTPKIMLKGHAVTSEHKPVDYASVLLSLKTDTTKVYGTITDENGNFTVEMPRGAYRLKLAFMGYEPLVRDLELGANTDLGDVQMQASTVMLNEVVVTGNMVTREADRFVVNVASTPLAAGKTSKEMLSLSPGVWITDKGEISINGRTGTQVMIDERMLRMSGDELVAYLENIKAEDILKIEVIPYAGAEFDASATGGIIKITMKKQREEGLEGSVSMRYGTSIVDHKTWQMSPGLNLNYKYNKLSLYGKVNYRRNNWTGGSSQQDIFQNRDRQVLSTSAMSNLYSNTGGQVGAVYDINDKQSVGAEINITANPYNNKSDGRSTATENGLSLFSNNSNWSSTNYFLVSTIANYSLKLDTLGSTFKTFVSYTYRDKQDSMYYHTNYSGIMNYDTLSRYLPTTRYDMFAVRTEFDIALSKRSKLNTGLKYSRNVMDNVNPYEFHKNDIWNPLPLRSSVNNYSENITALYASFSTKFKNNISLLLGLRGEHTYAVPATNNTVAKRQNYFDLFPNANLSIPLNKKQSYTVILGYGRKIGRPSFWQLSPFRQPVSDYLFMEGNPNLKPSYTNDYNLTWVLARKYTITFGAQQMKDAFGITVAADPSDPNIMLGTQSNLEKSTNYYVSISIPTQITKWWMLNANLNGANVSNTIDAVKQTQNTFRGNMSNTFTFCKNYSFIVETFYMSPSLMGNVKLGSYYQINTGLKGSFLDKKLTATVYVNNITNNMGMNIDYLQSNVATTLRQQGMYRMLNLSLRYSFQAGKKIKVKTVDSGGEAQDNGGGKQGL